MNNDKNYLLSEKKLFLSGNIDLNPGREEIRILLSYGRRIICSSSTYFLTWWGGSLFILFDVLSLNDLKLHKSNAASHIYL